MVYSAVEARMGLYLLLRLMRGYLRIYVMLVAHCPLKKMFIILRNKAIGEAVGNAIGDAITHTIVHAIIKLHGRVVVREGGV